MLAKLSAGLDDAQRQAVFAPIGPLVIVAGAGSGKTTTLVRRIAHLVASGAVGASQVLAVSHTTKASLEIKERLRAFDDGMADVACHTVHAAAWKVVRRFCGYTPELLSSNFRTVADATRFVIGSRGRDSAVVLEILGEIEWGGARLLDPQTYEDGARKARRELSVEHREVAEVWKVYEHQKKEMGALDFADVLKEATRLLHDSSIGETVRSTWRAIVVDEYQDTDRSQHAFLNALRARRPLWTVVGDPRQTIYSFKGADTDILQEALSESGATVVHLTTSWRCTAEILDEANTVIGGRYGAQLESTKHGDAVEFVSAYDDDEEVRKTIQQIQTWARHGHSYEETAVLYRFNSMSPRFEAALTEAQIPYQVAGESKFFDRADIRAVLLPFGKAARRAPDADANSTIRQAASTTGWDENTAPRGSGAARGRWEMTKSLVDLAERSQKKTAGELLAYLLLLAKTGAGVGITLGTIHAAKGLEWENVCVVGCVNGQIPSVYAKSANDMEEERRLLYVAMTRAKSRLVISYPRKRFKRPAEPSSLLPQLRSHKVTRAPSVDSSTSGRGARTSTKFAQKLEASFECGTCGKKLKGAPARILKTCSAHCLQGEKSARYARLVEWRDAMAADTGEHPDEIITDAALFRFLANGTTGLGWRPSVRPPSI